MLRQPLFLIGHMACGKTTLGRALSARTGIPFIDIDEAIEAESGCSVPEFFASAGEARFRQVESQILLDIIRRCHGHPAVIGCGGGTPCRPANMSAMLKAGTVIWLRADDDVTLRRIVEAGDTRPRLAGMSPEEIKGFMAAESARRDPVYASANATFDSSRLDTPEEIRHTTDIFISQFID